MTPQETEVRSDDRPLQATVNGIDGPTLRSLRMRKNVSLRQVARAARMSHGHLSKVERGEVGRPVTPAVLNAYASATGVPLNTPNLGDSWQLGQLSPVQRAHFNSTIGGLSVGGPLNDAMGKVLDGSGKLPSPEAIGDYHVQQLSLVAELLERLQGTLPGLVARVVLRWIVGLLDQYDRSQDYQHTHDHQYARPITMSEQTRAGLFAVVSRLARRAGQAAVDIGSHPAARTHFTVGLYAAVTADDADLRAVVLAEIASQHHGFGQHDDCLAIARLGQVDERVSEPVRSLLDQIKARAMEAKRQAVLAVEQAISGADDAADSPHGEEEA
jgi:Helix-turn-helix domain